MKKYLIGLSIFGMVLLANTCAAWAQTNQTGSVAPQGDRWKKSDSGTWQGKKDSTTYWYKTEKGKLNWSSDNRNWSSVPDNTWVGYDGKWYRMDGDNLSWSLDGTSWANVPDRVWRGADGNWYWFDNNWVLWSGGNGTLPPAHTDMK